MSQAQARGLASAPAQRVVGSPIGVGDLSKDLSHALELAGVDDPAAYTPASKLPPAMEFSAPPPERLPENPKDSLAERLEVPQPPVEPPTKPKAEPTPRPPAAVEVAQEDPPAPVDPEVKRNRNRMPIVSLPSDGFLVPETRWSRLASKSSGYIELGANPKGYDLDYSMFFCDTYDNISNPGEDVIVWDFVSPIAERNQTSRNSASSVQFRYTSTDQELTVDAGPKYTLEVTVWDRRFPEGKVINGAAESSPLIRDNLTFCAGVSARDPGTWTLKRTRNGEALADEQFQIAQLPPSPEFEWRTFSGGNYSAEESRDLKPNDQFLAHRKVYTLAPLLQDIVPPVDPGTEPEEQSPPYAKKCEVFWHWYSPNPEDNVTAQGSYFSVQLYYQQNAAATRYTLRTRVWDSRYPNGRLGDFQSVVAPPLESYTLLSGSGLPRNGTWQVKEVINGVTSEDLTATGSDPDGAPPVVGGSSGRPDSQVLPPVGNFHAGGSGADTNFFVVRSSSLPAGDPDRYIYPVAGVEIRNAATNEVLGFGEAGASPGEPYISVPVFSSQIANAPPGTVVVARPYVSLRQSYAAKAPDLDSDKDSRLAYHGYEDGQMLDTLGLGLGWKPSQVRQVAQILDTNSYPKYFGRSNLYPQIVVPDDAASRQYTSVPGSVNQELDLVTGQTRHSVTDLAIKTLGLPIVITRHFNSNHVDRLPSRGWTYSYERSLMVPFTNAGITYRNADGTTELFEYVGGNRWEASAKSAMEGAFITNDSATDYTVTYKSKVKEVFSRPLNGYPYEALLTKEIDRNGNANVYKWNATGTELASITDPIGRKVLFEWQAVGLPKTITDWTGRQVQYFYQNVASGALLLTRVVDAEGVPMRYDYAKDLRPSSMSPTGSIYHLVAVKQPAGYQDRLIPSFKTKALGALSQAATAQKTRTVFSQSGVPGQPITKSTIASFGAGSQTSTVNFDSQLRPVKTTDPLGGESTFEYDPQSRLKKLINPENQALEYTWDDQGHPLTAKDPRGIVTEFTWEDDNLTQVTRPYSVIDKFTYDDNSNILTSTDPENHKITYTYGNFGLMSTATNERGAVWRYHYDTNGYLDTLTLPNAGESQGAEPKWIFTNDAMGRRTQVKDPRGNIWKYTYDAKDRVTLVTFPDLSTNKMVFDGNNLLKFTFDQQNKKTEYQYNAALQVAQVLQPGGRIIKYSYDEFGRVSRLTNPKNVDTIYTYDDLNRPKTITYPGNITEGFTYDKIGNLTRRRKGDGTELVYTYDIANRLTKLEHPSLTTPITSSYDDLNRRLSMTDSTGTTSWNYNKNSQPILVTAPATGAIQYDYDNLGRLEKVTDPQDVATTYTFDNRNQMKTASQDGQTISYAYDVNGNLTGKTLPNGVVCNTSFDILNRPERLEYAQGMGAPFFSEDYTYFMSGNLKQVKTTANGSPVTVQRYGYDDLYQLLKVEKKVGAAAFAVADAFTYDIHGNMTQRNATTFDVNGADQTTSAGSAEIEYDTNGNHKRIDESPVIDRAYTFNHADLPTKITAGQTTVASYEYDGDNKRVHRTTNGGDNLRYLWSGSEIVKEYNSDNSVKAQYLMGMGREAIKVNGQWHFYGADRLGTTRFLTNSTGNKSATYEYDAYGFETTSGQTVYNPFRYTGQQWDSGENHLYLRNRYYYSGLCKFLVRDPIRYDAGTNLYAYCGNNPINAIDPSGLRENNPLQAVSVGGPSKLNASYQPQWNEIAAEDSISADLEAEIATGNISRIKETLEIAAMSGDPTKFAKLIAIYKAGEQALRNNLSSAPRFDCFSVSETLSAQLTRAGISNTLVRIQADASFMFWNGVRFGETGLHQAVRVGNMIYDKLTGPAGMYVDEYMKIMDKGSINPQMIPWP